MVATIKRLEVYHMQFSKIQPDQDLAGFVLGTPAGTRFVTLLLQSQIKKVKQENVYSVKALAESFDAQSVGLRLQKKLLGKMTSRRVVSAFIDETTARLLNNLYRLGRDLHDGDKRAAEKAIRRLIKTVIKTGILYRNEQFSADELATAEDFRKRFRIIAMTIVSFHQVDFTYDGAFLMGALSGACKVLKQLVARHLSEKSLDRIDNVFSYFGDRDFLDAAFKAAGSQRELREVIVQDLNTLLENNVL